MASKNVQVLCPNAHRVTVKVTPTTSILQIIEEACRKKGFSADEFDIKSEAGKNPIDVTLPMRYANLPNNARLELIKAVKPRGSADATTSITLHLQDGARLKPIDFPATATLWNVLQDFEKQENGPLLGADDTEPVIIYLRDQISGTSRLKQTSLKSVGLISGRAVLRLLNRPKTNESMDIGQSEASTSLTMLNLGQSESKKKSADVDMMEDPLAGMPLSQDQFRMIQQISEGYAEYQRQSDGTAADQTNDQVPLGIMFPGPGRDFLPPAPALSAKPKKSTSASPPVAVVRPQSDFANFKFPESSSISTSEDDLPTLLDDSSDPCNREQKVFHLDVLKAGSTTSSEDMDVDDSFFELTLEDLKTRMSTLKKMAVEDTPLMTACMRERLEESRFAQYQRTLIRVHFPDKLVLQGMFRLKEKVGALYDFVASNLESPKESFYLYVTPPREDLKDKDLTMMKAGLAPAANVYFGSKFNKESHLSRDCIEATVSANEVLRSFDKIGGNSSETNNSQPGSSICDESKETPTPPAKRPTTSSAKSDGVGGGAGGKMPKWFAAGKKK